MQTIPYLRNPDERVRVYIYVDASQPNKPRYLSDFCWLTQAESPCKGDISSPCGQCFAKCNHPDKSVCMDEVGKLLSENDNQLPEYMEQEWADFAHETWEIKSYIDNQTINPDPLNPEQLKRDVIKYYELKFKLLLKDWSLSKYADYQLKHRKAGGLSNAEELVPESLNILRSKLDPDFVDHLIRSYERREEQNYQELSQKAISEIKNATGLTAKN